MHDYPEAYGDDHLHELLDANSAVDITREQSDRLLDLAQQRADARGERNALESDEAECVIGTDWTGFAGDEFGYDGGELNQFALGVHNGEVTVSTGTVYDVFNDTIVVQQGWLESGDNRMTQVETYEDDEYDGSTPGELWIPKGAQDYIAIIGLAAEAIHGDPELADAM